MCGLTCAYACLCVCVCFNRHYRADRQGRTRVGLTNVCVCVLQIQPSPEHLKATGLTKLPKYDCYAKAANITVPNLNLGYPEELGGR